MTEPYSRLSPSPPFFTDHLEIHAPKAIFFTFLNMTPPTTPLLHHEDNPTHGPTPPLDPLHLRPPSMAALRLRILTRSALASAALNLAVASLGPLLLALLLRRCGAREKAPVAAASAAAAVRIASVLAAGIAQGATASTIARRSIDGGGFREDEDFRRARKMQYKRWLWWTRFGMAVTVLQFVVALYLMVIIVRDFSYDGNVKKCIAGQHVEGRGRKQTLMIFFLVLVWIVVIIQCLTGSDVLRWRSFYATHDIAWKAHYQEVFDHGMREALCCLGRVKYLSVLEEDEIYSVARLLGDLVAYRASGTGHMELLAGLALLQRHKHSPNLYSEFMEAPKARIREAAMFHPFAEAAYTGPLLDFGRNPILFPCAWLHRQGILTPWTRNRRPVLHGDNWWRGHAAAFLKYVKLSPGSLRRGRVCQTRREAAYFIVVLHDLRSVVIAVRGTETPEDLITDGLCKECTLSMDDLDGLINSDQLHPHVRESVLSSFPHYGHSGIVESARELFMQIEGQFGDKDASPSETSGFLSSLLGAGCECHGYNIRIVGHSLGGAVATFLGIREKNREVVFIELEKVPRNFVGFLYEGCLVILDLDRDYGYKMSCERLIASMLYGRYPNLHVYAYGPLPCVDPVIADACSDFVTSIVHNDEFSARLSVNSILRLRAAAISALSVDSTADSAMITKLVRRILHVNKYKENGESHRPPTPSLQPGSETVEDTNHNFKRSHLKYTIKGGAFLCGHAVSCMMNTPDHHLCSHVKENFQMPSGIVPEPGGLSDKDAYTFTSRSPQSVQDLHRREAPIFDDLVSEVLKEGNNEYNDSEFLKGSSFECTKGYKPAFDESSGDFSPFGGQASPFEDVTPSRIQVSVESSPEMYLPGLVVHLVPEERSVVPLWKSWRVNDRERGYKAYVANRESFKDIVVTPYMFLDHLPWRCHYALQRVLQGHQESAGHQDSDLFNEAHIV